MTRQVALFRGVNVGGHNRVPMAELRDTFASLGFTGIVSLIQSGNVCFDTDGPAADVAAAIRQAVAHRFAVDVPVVLRTAAAFTAALDAHPFPPGDVEPKLHHIMFLRDRAPADTADLVGDHTPGAEYVAIGHEIHVRYPLGSARSTFTVDVVDRRLHTTATARNLPTCEKIAAALVAS